LFALHWQFKFDRLPRRERRKKAEEIVLGHAVVHRNSSARKDLVKEEEERNRERARERERERERERKRERKGLACCCSFERRAEGDGRKEEPLQIDPDPSRSIQCTKYRNLLQHKF
jgi:hypothetical protein